MRVIIALSSSNEIVLPIHYNHILQGLIYNSFFDESFAEFLHDEGYRWNKQNFKLFSFSRLIGKYKIDKQKKLIFFQSPVELIITSCKEEIIKNLATTIITRNTIRLGQQDVCLKELKFKNFNIKKPNYNIEMLSPVVTYRTDYVGNKKRTYYFSPWEEEFAEQIRNNLFKKYELNTKKKVLNKKFDIEPLFKKDFIKPNIVCYRDYIIKGWSGKYQISGDSELLKLAYDTGLGAKNSLGHGCFEFL